MGLTDPSALASDRALAKARSKLHVPALWTLNDRVLDTVESQGLLHVAVGPDAEGERQMLFDQLYRLRRGDVLILDRGFPTC